MNERDQSRRFETDSNVSMDSFSLYMSQVNSIPLLEQEAEIELASKVQIGKLASEELHDMEQIGDTDLTKQFELDDKVISGLNARDQLVQANLRLVVKVVNRYRFSPSIKMDLIQEGNLGLFRAVDNFDPTLGFKFSTYAFWHIRQKVSSALWHNGSIKVPYNLRVKNQQITRAQEELSKKGDTVTDETIAHHLHLSTNDVRLVRQRYPGLTLSLNEVIGDGSVERGDLLADPHSEEDIDAVIGNIWTDVIVPQVKMTDRERTIVAMLCGLDGHKPSTLQQVGDYYGITRERVRQIRNSATSKILKVFKDPDQIELLLSGL